MKPQLNLIDGQWIEGDSASENRNPSNIKDVVGLFTRANVTQVNEAVEAAQAAFLTWSMTSPQVRSDLLEKVSNMILARKDEIGLLLAREEGKTLVEAIGETVRAAQVFKFFAGEALRVAGDAYRVAASRHRC